MPNETSDTIRTIPKPSNKVEKDENKEYNNNANAIRGFYTYFIN